jgi:hypothetical protein
MTPRFLLCFGVGKFELSGLNYRIFLFMVKYMEFILFLFKMYKLFTHLKVIVRDCYENKTQTSNNIISIAIFL